MCRFPLFETISVLDGQVQNLSYHQQRFEQAVKEFFGCNPAFCLAEILIIPAEFQTGKVRCRIDYNATQFEVKFYPYQPKQITQFRCVEVKNWDYHLKFSDRKRFDLFNILQNEEVIIINNGNVSDCSIGNLLFLKQGVWYSPQDYLLKGTQLTALIDQNKVMLTKIRKEDLKQYESIMMINALNPFDEKRVVSTSNIDFFDAYRKY
ncbi:aminotransferase class IV family protein [Mannheimia sp. AT1]|uniref:Aminotransferase class IV family protein n=1 Tax=Mannheimia cairinae TaxID=3025936 RepID=A0ABT5MQR6_9PAST|nr:aminotransferase class IV family protein [Mannheimia cairinae]MDD0824517.1 aminotransferase class IV family protein [Mannheimia cairinae]MDD0825618.1 aminotransferase class IV family protein [Mannheimia cairinae]